MCSPPEFLLPLLFLFSPRVLGNGHDLPDVSDIKAQIPQKNASTLGVGVSHSTQSGEKLSKDSERLTNLPLL